MNKLAVLNAEIDRLNAERVKVINEAQGQTDESIKSLEWTKDCHGFLKINALACAGLPTYSITVVKQGGNSPSVHRAVTVMGDHPCYEQNMLYGRSFMEDYYTFYTSSKKTLIDFLEVVEFKSFQYNESDLEVLEAARKKSNACQHLQKK